MQRLKKIISARKQGFTLIELIVVIGIIGILIAVTLVAINPGRQFDSAQDAQRRADLRSVVNAVYQYAAENAGTKPVAITTSITHIGTGVGLVDLTTDLVPTYMPAIPADPDGGTQADTLYSIYLDANERVVATATSELNPGTAIQIVQ